jgi:hypothetical protein
MRPNLSNGGRLPLFASVCAIAIFAGCLTPTLADDWPMRGRDGTRNAVSPEKNPPTMWSV